MKSSNLCDVVKVPLSSDEPSISIPVLSDKPLASFAYSSIPSALKIKLVSDKRERAISSHQRKGVFVKHRINHPMRFGPLVGHVSSTNDIDTKPSPFPLKIYHQKLTSATNDPSNPPAQSSFSRLDLTNESICNWMMFVRPASNSEHQNLIVLQVGSDLFFQTIRSIRPKEELRVWYSADYAKMCSMPLLSPDPNSNCVSSSLKCRSTKVTENQQKENAERRGTHLTGKMVVRRSTRRSRRRQSNVQLTNLDHEDYPDEIHCFVCQLTFPQNEMFEIHKFVHSESSEYETSDYYKLKCGFCFVVTDSPIKLAQHMKEHAIVEPMLFPSIFHVKLVDTADPSLPYACVPCGLYFSTFDQLDAHKKETHSSIEGTSQPTVTKTMANDAAYRPEVRNSKRVKKLTTQKRSSKTGCFPCVECGLVFGTKGSLATHFKKHLNSHFFECKVCHKTFKWGHEIHSHGETHMDPTAISKDECFPCPKCTRKYPTFTQLNLHSRQIHSDRSVYCSECPRIFTCNSKLNRHMQSHRSERHQCSMCNKSFINSYILRKHTNKNHKDSIEEQPKLFLVPKPNRYFVAFKCPGCNQGFQRRGMLVNHLIRAHKDISLDSVAQLKEPVVRPKRIFECSFCQLVYMSAQKRDQHMFRHHPEASSIRRRCVQDPCPTVQHSTTEIENHHQANGQPLLPEQMYQANQVDLDKLNPVDDCTATLNQSASFSYTRECAQDQFPSSPPSSDHYQHIQTDNEGRDIKAHQPLMSHVRIHPPNATYFQPLSCSQILVYPQNNNSVFHHMPTQPPANLSGYTFTYHNVPHIQPYQVDQSFPEYPGPPPEPQYLYQLPELSPSFPMVQTPLDPSQFDNIFLNSVEHEAVQSNPSFQQLLNQSTHFTQSSADQSNNADEVSMNWTVQPLTTELVDQQNVQFNNDQPLSMPQCNDFLATDSLSQHPDFDLPDSHFSMNLDPDSLSSLDHWNTPECSDWDTVNTYMT